MKMTLHIANTFFPSSWMPPQKTGKIYWLQTEGSVLSSMNYYRMWENIGD